MKAVTASETVPDHISHKPILLVLLYASRILVHQSSHSPLFIAATAACVMHYRREIAQNCVKHNYGTHRRLNEVLIPRLICAWTSFGKLAKLLEEDCRPAHGRFPSHDLGPPDSVFGDSLPSPSAVFLYEDEKRNDGWIQKKLGGM